MPMLSVVLFLLLLAPAARADPGEWVAPLDGPVVVRRAFAPPSARWAAGHRGADLASFAGAAVRAAGAGRVSYAGVLAGRGVLAVTHGALRTTYEPVRPLVRAGARVRAGDVVAVLLAGHGVAGHSAAGHGVAGHGPAPPGQAVLHWGLLRGATYLDPLSLLRRGPSRLLPVAPAPPAPPPGPGPPDDLSWPPWGAPVRTAGAPPAAPRGAPRAAPAAGAPGAPRAPAAVPALVVGASLAAAAAGVTAVVTAQPRFAVTRRERRQRRVPSRVCGRAWPPRRWS